MNMHSDPDKFGLESFGEIDWSDGSYCFDYTTVWRTGTGAFVFGEDSGCSCPSPFESEGLNDLIPIDSLAEFKAHLDERATRTLEHYDRDRRSEVVALVERLHAAGLR